jgi:hypothetical protein
LTWPIFAGGGRLPSRAAPMSAKIDRMSIMALSFLFAWVLARQFDRAY